MLSVALLILAMVLIVAVPASFYFLDRLIRYEYEFHRDEWERDGRPNSPFFRPPETTWFRSGMAFQRCALRWPLHTPSWVREDPSARALLRSLRWCLLTWNIGFISLVVFIRPHVAATPRV